MNILKTTQSRLTCPQQGFRSNSASQLLLAAAIAGEACLVMNAEKLTEYDNITLQEY